MKIKTSAIATAIIITILLLLPRIISYFLNNETNKILSRSTDFQRILSKYKRSDSGVKPEYKFLIPSDIKEHGLKGNVRTVEKVVYSYGVPVGSVNLKTNILESYYFEFDSLGNETMSVSFVSPLMFECEKKQYVYENGLKVRELCCSKGDTVEIVYDYNSNIINVNTVKGGAYAINKWVCDDKGRMVECFRIDNGESIKLISYDYNENNDIIRETNYHNGKINSEKFMQYDDKNNVINMKYASPLYPEPLLQIRNKKYNENNNLVSYEQGNSKYMEIIYKEDLRGNVLFKEAYKDGNPISCTEVVIAYY